MRFWISGPRLFGLRTGVSFGPEYFRRTQKRTPQCAPTEKTEGAPDLSARRMRPLTAAMSTALLIAVGVIEFEMISGSDFASAFLVTIAAWCFLNAFFAYKRI
jgi:hypothetical protein